MECWQSVCRGKSDPGSDHGEPLIVEIAPQWRRYMDANGENWSDVEGQIRSKTTVFRIDDVSVTSGSRW